MMALLTSLTKIYSFLKTHWKAILMVLGVFFLLNSARGCYHKIVSPRLHFGPSSPIVTPLPKDTKERISVKNGIVTIQTPTETKVIEGVREGSVDIKNDGKVILNVKNHGFSLVPQIGVAVNSTGPKITVGTEIYYWNKLSLLSGLGVDKYIKNTCVYLGLGWTPNKIIHHTSLWIGGSIDTQASKSVVVGVAIKI